MTFLSNEIQATNQNIISPYVFCCYWTSHFKEAHPYGTGEKGASPIQRATFNSFPMSVVGGSRDVNFHYIGYANSFDLTNLTNTIFIQLNHGYKYFVDIFCADFINIDDISVTRYAAPKQTINVEKYIPNNKNCFEPYAYAKFDIRKNLYNPVVWDLYLLKISAVNNLGYTNADATNTLLFDIPNVRILIYGIPFV